MSNQIHLAIFCLMWENEKGLARAEKVPIYKHHFDIWVALLPSLSGRIFSFYPFEKNFSATFCEKSNFPMKKSLVVWPTLMKQWST